MLSCMIDAMEGREVATSDIPWAFLHTDYDKGDIHIKLEGAMVTLLEDIDPGYYKKIIFIDKRGRKCMYAEAKKAIYGTLEASLLYCKKTFKNLRRNGISEKWIRLVCHEQDHWQQTMHYTMVCRWPEDITCWSCRCLHSSCWHWCVIWEDFKNDHHARKIT